LRDVFSDGVDWIQLVWAKYHCWSVANMVMNDLVPWNMRNSVTVCADVLLSGGRYLLQG
jgi:hypothetical protein